MVQSTTNPVSRRNRNSILVILTGMLFFYTSFAQELDLASQLFREGRWEACRRECMRAELLQKENTPLRIQLTGAICMIRMGRANTDVSNILANLSAQTEDSEVAAGASYEAGRLLWEKKRFEDALKAFSITFYTTTNRALFLHAACSTFFILNENKSLKRKHPSLAQQINTSRILWSAELFAACRLEKKTSRFKLNPSGWLIQFYRSQISPSIGQRCTLEPSCSEYFKQAAARHGWLSIPMIGDRFVREPDVNKHAEKPIVVNGKIRYLDSVDEHDFWMKK